MARDNAVEYSIDQAQRMFGKGVEVIGRAAGIESIFNYGQEIVKQQDEDIRLGQYKPQYTVGLREAYNQGGLDDGIGWLLEKTGENVASGGAALVGGLASALTAPFSVPAAALIGGATLIGSGIMGTGETAEEMEQKTGDYNEAVAIGAGTIIGILDRFGAGKVIPKDELLSMTGKQLIKALGAEGKTDAAKEIGKRIGKSIAFEGATEGVQEGVVMGATGITGGEYTGLEIADRILEGTLLGSTMGGATTGGIEALRQGPGVVNQIQDIMSGPGPGGLTPQMAMAGAQLSPDRAQMSLIPEVPKTSAEILMSEKAGDETGGGTPVDPIMAEDADKLIRDPDDNIAMTDGGRHFSRLALRLQQLPFSAEGLTGRQVLQELGVLGEQDNKMPSSNKKRDYIGSITDVREMDTGIPRVKTRMKEGLSEEDKARFIAAKRAKEVPPDDLVETVQELDKEGKPVTIKGPSPTFTFNKQVLSGSMLRDKDGNLVLDSKGKQKPEFISSPTPSSNKGGDLYQSGLEDFLFKNLDSKISKDELLNEYKAYRPEVKTRLLLGSQGERAHGTYAGSSLEYIQRIPQLVEGFSLAPNTPDRKFDTVYEDFGIVQYMPNQETLLGRTKFPFPTKKQDDEFQTKNTDSITRARQNISNEGGGTDPTQDQIDAWLLKNEPSTVSELNSLAQQLGYDDPFGQVLDTRSTAVPFHKYYETKSILDNADSTGTLTEDPKSGESTYMGHTRGEIVKDKKDGKYYAQASETQADLQRRYEKELDKTLPEPGAWSFDDDNRFMLTPSDMRTLDEAKGATIDSKPEDSLITYEEDKKSLKEALSKKSYEEDVEVVNFNEHQKAEKELQNLEFVQDRIEGLEEQEYDFTKEFLPKFFKSTNNQIQRNIETEKNLDNDGFAGDPEFLRNGKKRAREAIRAERGETLFGGPRSAEFDNTYGSEITEKEVTEYLLKNEPLLMEALDSHYDKIKESVYLSSLRTLKNEFYEYGVSGGDISKYNEMLKNRRALNDSILSIKKNDSIKMDRTSVQKKFNPVYTFLDGVPSFMPGYAENKLVRDSGGLQGEEPIHTYYGQELIVDPNEGATNDGFETTITVRDEPVFGSQPHPLFLSNHMMYGPDTILIPKASHNGKYYPTDSNKRNDFETVIDILVNEVRERGFSDRSTKFRIAEIVQTPGFQDAGQENGTTWKTRKAIKPTRDAKPTAAEAQDFAEHTQNIDSFILTALSENIKPSEIFRMVENIITKEVLNRQAANIIARKTANEVRRKHKNELDQIQFSDSQDPDFGLNAELMRDMLSNKAKDTAERTHKKLMDKYTKELGFVPVFAPETVDFGASAFPIVDTDTGDTGFTKNREDRLNSLRSNIARTINLNMINPRELNLPSDADSSSAISNFNPNIFEQLAAQKTLQKNTDGRSIQSIKKDQFESARKLAKLRQEVEESKKAFEGFDPDGKELARRLSLMSADLSGVDPQQVKDLIKAINAGRIKFRTPAFGESSSADRFSYRNLIHYAMNEMPHPETGEKGLDGIIIPHRLDQFEVPGGRGGTAKTFGLNKYEAIPKKVLEEIAKETGATIETDYPMKYEGKSGNVYPSKRPVTKLIFNKDFKGKAIAQYKKGGIFEKFRKVS